VYFRLFYPTKSLIQNLGLILVDPAADAVVYPACNAHPVFEIKKPKSPRRMVSEGLHDLPAYSAFRVTDSACPDSRPAGSGEEMLKHFCDSPLELRVAKPSILSLAHYPLQSAISDWMLYRLLMSRYIKYYEYSFPTVTSRLKLFETDDLLDLHRWRRRSQQSLHKMQMTRRFVEHWRVKEQTPVQGRKSSSDELSSWDLLVMDLRYLEEQIEQRARYLEALGPIMTSLVQLIDSHKSIAQAEDIRRLTYIAIAFIPLTYITGIFSMSEPYGPGRKYFWVYWVAAVPTAAIIMGLLMLDGRVPALASYCSRLWKKSKEVFS
jgi:hypothetical protein